MLLLHNTLKTIVDRGTLSLPDDQIKAAKIKTE